MTSYAQEWQVDLEKARGTLQSLHGPGAERKVRGKTLEGLAITTPIGMLQSVLRSASGNEASLFQYPDPD